MIDAIKSEDFTNFYGKSLDLTEVKDSDAIADAESVKYYKAKGYYEDLGHGKINWYSLLRGVQGAELITAIASGDLKHVITNKGWMKDSLFCEYGYTLNFGTQELELWEGFQKKSQKGNPFGSRKGKGEEYYPCRKVGTISFGHIYRTDAIALLKEMKKFFKED